MRSRAPYGAMVGVTFLVAGGSGTSVTAPTPSPGAVSLSVSTLTFTGTGAANAHVFSAFQPSLATGGFTVTTATAGKPKKLLRPGSLAPVRRVIKR